MEAKEIKGKDMDRERGNDKKKRGKENESVIKILEAKKERCKEKERLRK